MCPSDATPYDWKEDASNFDPARDRAHALALSFDLGVREGRRQAREAVEKQRPEVGPHINMNSYRDGKHDAISAAVRAIDALEIT